MSLLTDIQLHYEGTHSLDIGLQTTDDGIKFTCLYSGNTANQSSNETATFIATSNDVAAMNCACNRGAPTFATAFPDINERQQFAKALLCVWSFVALAKHGQIDPFSKLLQDFEPVLYWGQKTVNEIVLPVMSTMADSQKQLPLLDSCLFDFVNEAIPIVQNCIPLLESVNEAATPDVIQSVQAALKDVNGQMVLEALKDGTAKQVARFQDLADRVDRKADKDALDLLSARMDTLEVERTQMATLRRNATDQIRTQQAAMEKKYEDFCARLDAKYEEHLQQVAELEARYAAKLDELNEKYKDIMKQQKVLHSAGWLSDVHKKVLNRSDFS